MARTNGGTGTTAHTDAEPATGDHYRPMPAALRVLLAWVVFGLLMLTLSWMSGCSSGSTPARTVITPGTAESTFTTTEDRGRTVIVRTAPTPPAQPMCPAPQPAEPRVIVRVVPVEEQKPE